MSASAKPKRRPAGRPPAPKPYHHGDLRRVLIDAALQLAEEGGAAAVSVREAARRAGVSPGAPFRHFESRDALMTAVASEAQRRFRTEINTAMAEAPANDPLSRFRSFGLAYLRWAMRNPAHFEIISSGRYFDHDGAADLSRDNAELIALAERMLADAFAAGALRTNELKPARWSTVLLG
jgi:AcrR family transcriptional regulator